MVAFAASVWTIWIILFVRSHRLFYRCRTFIPLRAFLLLPFLALAAFAAEDAVELKAVRAALSYLYFDVVLEPDTDKIAEIRVAWVAPGSTAEKAGLRAGDRLIAIDGVPVVGAKRSDVSTPAGRILVRGKEVTFTGQRGLFRTKWSLTATIDLHGKMERKEDKPAPPRAVDPPPASAPVPNPPAPRQP